MTNEHLDMIERAVLSWPGVTREPGRFNSTAYKLGRREIGHVHRNGVADIAFPKAVRDELIAASRAEPHQADPRFAAVSFYVRTSDDVPRAIELFRMGYDRLTGAVPSPGAIAQPDGAQADDVS
ncbi:MAG: DUF5519 family protein [Chloroflexota bacterium]|nr:DUF5519 family protein [Chloroflexota bacterium]